MDIVEFFQLSSGKWFSHRTNHFLAGNQSESAKSEVQFEILPNTDPEVTKLCEQHSIDPALVSCGTRITWKQLESTEKQSGSTVLVAIADSGNLKAGKLIRKTDEANSPSALGQFAIGEDEALTLTTQHGETSSEERLWFASPNLRLRTSILKEANGFSATSFCSEIRMGVTKPAK